ncbi:MAG: acyl-CoA dehydrogenase family protein [Acidimicrobiales bacterium]
MDLDFTEEQDMLRNLVRSMCNDVVPLNVVRELEDDEVGYSVDLWSQLADLDLIGLMVPAEYGGSGMSMIEGAIVYEELGRGLVPSPHLVSAVLSAGALVAAGSDDQKTSWLPKLVSGESIFSVAWLEPAHGFGPKGVDLTATREGDGWRLDGVKWHVPFASSAERLLVLARTGSAPTDITLFLVDPAVDEVTLEQQKTIGSDNQYAVTFAGAKVTAADVVGEVDGGWPVWDRLMYDAVILLAASAVGGAHYALEITTQYAKDRQQFDKPLGAFMAISHYLADAKTNVDGAEVLVWEAAWARSEGRDISTLAPMAKLFACKTYRDVTAMAQQVFGGVGFTVEYDIQLYFRRAKQLQITWWNERELEERIATQVLDAEPATAG